MTGPIFVKVDTKPEKTKSVEPEAMKEKAKTTAKRQGFQGRCYQCGELGHIARYCRRKPAQKENTPNHELHNRFQPLASIKQCFKCGNTGHIARSCHLQAYQKRGPRSEPMCYKCGVKGHMARSCKAGSITIITTVKEVLNSTATYTSTPGYYTCRNMGILRGIA